MKVTKFVKQQLHFFVCYICCVNDFGGVIVKHACLECCRLWVWAQIRSNQRL